MHALKDIRANTGLDDWLIAILNMYEDAIKLFKA